MATNQETGEARIGWDDTEIPKYRASRAVEPSPNARYRLETPLAHIFDDSWQYGIVPVARGEIVHSTAWPHPGFVGLNESGRRIQEFFQRAQKSRLPLSPWYDGRLRLDDGLSFGEIKIATPGFEPAERASNQQGSRRTATRRG